MKTQMKALTCCALMAISKSPVEAQALRGIADAKVGVGEGFVIAERGPHHRVWSKTTWSTNRLGKGIAQVSSYTELETGMHVLKEGRWVDANPEITITPEGAAAIGGAHQVRFATNLRSTNAVVLTTSDGKLLRTWIAGLAYYDESTGKSVLLARLQDCVGELHSPNRAVYVDAFDALEADVEYINTKAGLEQNIILRAQPPSPAKWNLNPATTRLQVLTEFFDPPTPSEIKASRAAMDGDKTLSFGAMRMGRGKAFLIRDASENRESIPVSKQWVKTSAGRTFLIEEVKFDPLSTGAKSLPTSQRTAKAAPVQIGGGDSLLAALQQTLPPAQSAHSGAMRMAKLELRKRPGFVVDYAFLAGATDFTFKGDTTYYCTNAVNLNGTTVFEGGTVVKFATNSNAGINLSGTIDCRTSPYRPAMLTVRDDNTVGETITNSTGLPQQRSGGSYPYLTINDSDNSLRYMRLAYAGTGLGLGFDYGEVHLAHMQFTVCRYGIEFNGNGENTVYVDNSLFYVTTNVFSGGYDNYVRGQHLTVNKCNKLWVHSGSNNGELYLTNSLLVDTGIGFLSLGVSVYNHSPALYTLLGGDVFQTVGAGAHYLIDGSTNRNAGTTNISASLLAELRKKTTYPPIVSSLQISAADVQLYPQAQRDTDIPDIGYHYDPLDYAFATLRITNSTMTVMPGTAIGAFCEGYGYGLALWPGAKFHANGHATAPIWIARYNTVQEQANLNWTNFPSGSDWSIVGNWLGGADAEIKCRFTKFSALANRSTHFGDYNNSMPMWFTDCEFHGGNFSVSASILNMTNCLFNRVHSYVADDTWANDIKVRNSTFSGGDLTVAHWDSGDFLFRNNLFAASTNHQDGDIDGDWNAYTTGTTRFTVNGAQDETPSGFTFAEGPLGLFYQSTSDLIDQGSWSAEEAGLFHYTVKTSNTKEGNETTTGSPLQHWVDIGYHYVAVDGNGVPFDDDGDGIPDYQEDANGDGSTSGDPTSWTTYNSPNGLASGSGLVVFTPLH